MLTYVHFASSLVLLASVSTFVQGCAVADPEALTQADLQATSPQALSEATDCSCPVDKIAFSRLTGCSNDGSVEFCVPAGNDRLHRWLQSIEPSISFVGSQGRARCDLSREVLVMVPLDPEPSAQCVTSSEMTEAMWNKVCRMARHPAVKQVVHTFYE